MDASSMDSVLDFLAPNIQKCVDICAHTTLPSATGSGFVPSRLIDVRGSMPRVVDTYAENISFAERYTTLSYCWGTREEGLAQLRLTRESAARLQAGFLTEAMSAVQKDAVAVTRTLGVGFIWIDALCILQNDAADWEHESALMHMIYDHSHLTICNLKTASCHSSFLTASARATQSAVVPFDIDEVDGENDENSDEEGAECYQIGPGCSPVQERRGNGETWAQLDFNNSAWITRAWTFQEAAMSPRMALFANSGVSFSCSRKLVWEYGRVEDKPFFRSAESLLTADSSDVYQSWYLDVVRPFSGRMATNLDDSLPALSGIAHMFGAALNDEYVAGLWKKDLVAGLFWTLDDQSQSSLEQLVAVLKDRSEYIGPSWSWVGRASGSGGSVSKVRSFGPGACNLFPTRGPAPSIGQECYALDAQAMLAGVGLDDYGKITGAVLGVKARFYPLAFGCCLLPYGDDADRLADVGNFCIEQLAGTFVFSYNFDFFPNSDPADPSQSWVQSLSLALIGSIEYEKEEAMPCGLIVHQAGTDDRFWRVGTFGPASVEVPTEIASDLDLSFFDSCEVRDLHIV